MKLQTAATWFLDTWVEGWDGTQWVQDVAKVDLQPHDRFVSEREFGNKRRYILCHPDETALDTYPIIRFPQSGSIYLVGTVNNDIAGDRYSKMYLLHLAAYTATWYEYQKTTAASGVASLAVRNPLGSLLCDVERVTFSNPKEPSPTKLTEVTLTFARNVAIDTTHEIKIDSLYYDIQESYMTAGFRQCRAISKRSA